MLHLETVKPDTFSLLKELMKVPELQGFSLVGGTALSLLYGHRASIDLDLFSPQPFQNKEIENVLIKNFGNDFDNRTITPQFGIFCFIKSIKVDFVRHPHPLINKIQSHDEVRMFSIPDIAAMKIQAIFNRGRKKDFWDIAELLNHISIKDFVLYHKQKYADQNLMITVPHAMTYFADANDDEDPMSFKGQTWASVQKDIQTKVSQYLK